MTSTAQLNSVELTERTDVFTARGDSPDAPTEGVSLAYPEGGREAWTCLLGSALIMFPSFGFQASIGSVQDYLSVNQLADHTVSEVGWITAVLIFLTLFMGVQIGPLFDRYGPRMLLISGSVASFASYILLAECTQYWHFMICLGVFGGSAAAVITTVAIAVLSHWFYRRRALASGLCMAGSSAGGAILPLLLRHLFPTYGWKWTIRVIAFIALVCYSAGTALVKGRLPPSPLNRATIDVRAFKSPRLGFLALAVFAFEFIIFGCAALVPTYVRYAGLAGNTQFYSLTLLNSMSLVGRVVPGFLADLVGRFNILLSLVIMTLLVMATVWIPVGSRSESTLYAVVAIFGFGSGGWISLAPVCAGQLCRTEEYGRFYSTLYSVAAFGALLTVPIGGQLLQSTTPQILIGFYSAVLVVGLTGVVLSRWAILEWKWRWKVKV
ncbi:Putative Monocarboxylate permease homologue, mch4 [Aspergillus calidoustus]|uniref:Putative Monocarboxylate permease homologue, mch4 n=1 Tax=Aspergillus calidoustus TaxID=454130 RepID=A0A0U5GGC3_ASPCI|nr:Putative Monocarboxylate permease homologue, mch4 [Aspergillus calidoustus]